MIFDKTKRLSKFPSESTKMNVAMFTDSHNIAVDIWGKQIAFLEKKLLSNNCFSIQFYF